MEERRDSVSCVFVETDAFSTKHGKVSESVREDLYFYLMLGRGEPIEGTGGLKEIRLESGDPDGKKWDVVFAAYNYPAKKERIYFLLVKLPKNVIKNLNQEQKRKLMILKEKVDEYVRRYYGT
jgi:hypothetical protein